MKEREPIFQPKQNGQMEMNNQENESLGDTHSSFSNSWRKYSIGVRAGQPYFLIEYYDHLPDSLSLDEKRRFGLTVQDIAGERREVYSLKYGPVPEFDSKEISQGTDIPESYYIFSPRNIGKYELGDNQQWSSGRLVEYLKNHKVVFYTGAGLSKGNVPDMNELLGLLGIDQEEVVDSFLRKALDDPEKNIDAFLKFRKAAATAPATKAHVSLSKISQATKGRVFTENLDRLHEKTGLVPFRVTAEELRDNIDPRTLNMIDAFVTIGLSADDHGLLAWYKHHNPAGKIIAINTSQPGYLGEGDVLVKGDVQMVLPQIEEALKEN